MYQPQSDLNEEKAGSNHPIADPNGLKLAEFAIDQVVGHRNTKQRLECDVHGTDIIEMTKLVNFSRSCMLVSSGATEPPDSEKAIKDRADRSAENIVTSIKIGIHANVYSA